MRNFLGQSLAILAVLAFSSPVWAAKTQTVPMLLNQPATFAGKKLQPGNYKVVANLDSNQVKVERDGKVVAQTEGKEINLKQKSDYAAVLFNGRTIHEIEFPGKTQAIVVPSATHAS